VTPAVVVAGNLLVDDLVFENGETRLGQAGGAVLYAALAARVWQPRVGCLSVVGTDYPRAMLDQLEARGIDLSGVRRLPAPGVRTWLLYESSGRQLVHRLGCPSHEEVSPAPADVPAIWRSARAVHLAPMPFDVQRALVESLADTDAFVSVDPHLPVTEATLPAWRNTLAKADAFFPGEDELLIGSGSDADVRAVLPRLATGRLRFVVLTRGARGGILYDARERCFHAWPARPDRIVDPTGAGDAFALGVVTAVVDRLSVDEMLRRGRVTASFALEAWGPEGLLRATAAAAADRQREWDVDEALA
jgi:sugar/nucleoside kinase (ribokinase family)